MAGLKGNKTKLAKVGLSLALILMIFMILMKWVYGDFNGTK